MLSRKQQAKGFLIASAIFFAWHSAVEWAKLLTPFLQWDAQNSVLQIATIYAVGNVFTLMGTLIVGHLMDTNGARMAGMLAAGLSCLFYIASSQASSFLGFLLVQPLKVAFSLNQVVESYVASMTDETERTRSVMRLSIAVGLASIIGPFLASKTAVIFDIRGSVVCAALLMAVVCIPLLFYLPESSHVPLSKRPRMLRLADYEEVFAVKSLRLTLGMRFLIDGPFMAFDTLSRQHIISYLVGTYTDMSYLFMVIGFTTVFTNFVLIRLLQARFDARQLLQFGLCVSLVAYIGISFSTVFTHYLVFMPMEVIGMSIVYAEFSAQTANCVDRNNVGKAMGLSHAVNLTSSTLFALVAGYFISEYDFHIWCYMAAFVSIVVIVLLQYYGEFMIKQAKNLPTMTANYDRLSG